MKTVRFGIIGCGLMGREFASAAARWCHLTKMDVRPELVAICGAIPAEFGWFTANFPAIGQVTTQYPELLANPDVEAVYVAVPHNLHAEIYGAVIRAGKHLMGEKPFGIDLAANTQIMQELERHPRVFARCASQFPFFPAVQQIGRMLEAEAFGTLVEVNSGFLHSSDLDPNKPINWKRRIETNGEYGVLGDLGMHACHMVFRAGFKPRQVSAVLSNLVPQRPDGKGGLAACETWDNGTLLCRAADAQGRDFPWTLKLQRIAPGQKNTWYLEVIGTRAAARFSSKHANVLELLEYSGGEQSWRQVEMGHAVTFASITGGIFETGFSDVVLQMWAAFLHELEHGAPLSKFAGCATPHEAALSHRLFTAALESQRKGQAVAVE